MAHPTFPASTSTSFDDLLKVKTGQDFVLHGYWYVAIADAVTWKRNGYESVYIKANRRNGGWEAADALEHRPYVGTLDEILGDEV